MRSTSSLVPTRKCSSRRRLSTSAVGHGVEGVADQVVAVDAEASQPNGEYRLGDGGEVVEGGNALVIDAFGRSDLDARGDVADRPRSSPVHWPSPDRGLPPTADSHDTNGRSLADLRAPNRVRKSVNALTDHGGSAVADAASHELVEEGKLLVAESGGHRTGHSP